VFLLLSPSLSATTKKIIDTNEHFITKCYQITKLHLFVQAIFKLHLCNEMLQTYINIYYFLHVFFFVEPFSFWAFHFETKVLLHVTNDPNYVLIYMSEIWIKFENYLHLLLLLQNELLLLKNDLIVLLFHHKTEPIFK